MLLKKKKPLVIGLFMGLTMSVSLMMNSIAYATETTEETKLDSVNLEKGITYVYGEDGTSISGINLNGNSIIIVESANSTDDEMFNNIYIDKNGNGTIDDEDTIATVGDSTDVIAGPTIYGVYKQKTEVPISITMNSGYQPAIYAVYQGEITTKDATAITLTVNGGSLVGTLFGAYESTVTTENATAVNLQINGGTVSCSGMGAAYSSEINTTGKTAIIVGINGGMVPATLFGVNASTLVSDGARAIEMTANSQSTEFTTSAFMGAYNSSIEVKNADAAGIYMGVKSGQIGSLYAINASSYKMKNTTAAAVYGEVTGGTVYTAQYVYSSSVESDGTYGTLIDIDASAGTFSQMSGAYASSLDAGKNTNLAVDLDLTGTAVVNGQMTAFLGTNSYSSTVDYNVVGGVDVNVNPDTKLESGYTVNYIYSVYGYAIIDGDVTIYLNNVRANSSYGLHQNVYVKGNLSYKAENVCEIIYQYGMYNSKVDGNVTVTMGGLPDTATSSYNYTYGAYGRYKSEEDFIGGDFSFTYTGGYSNNFYGIYANTLSSNVYPNVKGKVDINLQGGTLKYLYGAAYVDIGKDLVITTAESCVLDNYLYYMYYAKAEGNVKIDVANANTSTANAYLYTVQNAYIGGDLDVTIKGGYYKGVWGVYGYSEGNTVVTGNAEVTIQDVNKDATNYSSGSYSYGLSGVTVTGTAKVTTTNSKFYSYYGTYYLSCAKDVTVDITNVDGYSNVYGAQIGAVGGSITSTMENINAQYVYGVYQYSGSCGGSVTSNITNTSATSYLYGIYGSYNYTIAGDVKSTITDSTSLAVYGLSNASVSGSASVIIEDGTYGNSTTYSYFYGVSYSNIVGETTVEIKDISFAGYMYPYQSGSATTNGDVTVNIEGLALSLGYNSTSTGIYNTTSEGQKVHMVIDDTSTMPEDTQIVPGSSYTGAGTAVYKGEMYYAGKIVFEEDATYDVIHFTAGYFLIPEGVTVKANKEIYLTSGSMLLEGTLDGTLAGTLDDNGKYTGSCVWVNGGSMTQDLDKIQTLYYPLNVDYLAKGGTVTKTSGTVSTHSLRPEQSFAMVGSTLKYRITANEGYTLTSATVKTAAAEAATDAAVSGSIYSFDMEASATTFNVVFTGNQIVVGKTVTDPVLKLSQEYTAELPAYDMNSISISNDGVTGEVTYTVDETNGLPEGLELTDGKIIGTPTVAYENGKKTIIHITGKNDTTATLTLNFVVTAGDGKQTSQEGRITVDETNACIYLNGNSVVIETKDNYTAIYLDDNKDGQSDYEEPAFVGDLTNYTMYGVRNADAKDKLLITMNGGTVGKFYGSYNGDLVDTDDTLEVYLNGGSVGAFYGLYNATTSGSMKIVVGTDATVTSFSVSSGSNSYGGYYYDNKGVVTVYGTYTLKENISPTRLYVNGKLTIPEDVTVAVDGILYRYTNSEIYLKGNLSATTSYNGSGYYGHIIVQGGTLPEDNTWAYVYYPVICSTNLDKASLSFTNNYKLVTENDESMYYLCADASISTSMTSVTGYDYYYSVDDADYVATSAASFTFTMPRKAITLKAEYVPKQISVTKQFAEPVAIVNTEYTEESPVYDLATLVISDDTTSTYGGEVKYVLKSGSTLPSGLELSGSKIIGTPTKENQTGSTVTFVVTGRNGTTVNVDITISVMPKNYDEIDINDTVTISSYNINLNGTSIVVVQDPTNTSYASIYPDYNHDKIADNNIPLLVSGATSYNLSSYTIYGYSNTTTAYDGDISITFKGGNIKAIYGASGTSTKQVTVNGDVAVYVEGGYINNTYSKVYGVSYGTVQNVTLEVTGGTHKYSEFIAASGSTVSGNVNYRFGGTAQVTGKSGTDYYYVYAYAADNSTVAGDVNVTLGADSSGYGLYSSYTYFYGIYNSTVTGNANYVVNGYWYPNKNYFVYSNSTIGKNLDVDWNAGTMPYTYCAYNAEITGDILVDVAENATISGLCFYVLYLSDAANMYIDIPDSANGSIGTITPYYNGTETVDNVAYIYNKGSLQVDGEYTITKDCGLTSLQIIAGGDVIIDEGTTVNVASTLSNAFSVAEGAKLTNNGALNIENTYTKNIYGTLVNNGTMTSAGNLYIQGPLTNTGSLEFTGTTYVYSTLDNTGELKTVYTSLSSAGQIINRETGTWDVAGRIVNTSGGKLVNYGVFDQTFSETYYNRLGVVYTTKELNLHGSINSYVSSTSYSQIYYPVTLEYPSHCVESVTIAGDYVGTSGVDGDTNQYVRGGSTFAVTLGTQLLDTVVLTNVTYGSENKVATAQTDATWQGTALYEPFTVRVNYDAAEGIDKITLNKTTDRIENTDTDKPLVVDNYYSYSSPLYDLTSIEISNDIEEGVVAYTLDSSSTLPLGMYLKDGRLYGTLTQACSEEQKITFIIKGKNQTSEFFTLTLGAIDKKVPTWSVPTGLQTVVGKTLANVYVPRISGGTFSWPDSTVSVGDEVTTLEGVELLYTPNDTDNYDWETAATNAGATYENGVITCQVSIQVCAGTPTYTIPENLTATYGQTFGEVPIPSGDNDGVFTWNYASTQLVGSAGTHYYYVTYTPNDTEKYQTVSGIRVVLTVNKATPTYKKIESVSQVCGSTLADIVLPDVDGGKYQWITTSTTVPIDGTQYQAGFKPNDTQNYDWTKIDGWNSAWGCVVFPVTVYVEHTYATAWTYDEEYHWQVCEHTDCGDTTIPAEHVWNSGTVVKAATENAKGLMKYSCLCGATKTEEIAKLTHTHTYSSSWSYDDTHHWNVCSGAGCGNVANEATHTMDAGTIVVAATEDEEGTIQYTCTTCGYSTTESYDLPDDGSEGALGVDEEFTDESNDVTYMVTVENAEVAYVDAGDGTSSKVVIPATVTYGGVTYKVTSIEAEAFKNDKKLKTVVIGSNILKIGKKAFYGCKKLTTVTMGNNVTTIDDSAFQNCTALKKIVIPAKVEKIGKKAFYGCKKLTNITIKTTKLNTKNVGKDAFKQAGSANYSKLTVKVPKKKLKAYKTTLQKRGLSKSAKIK